MACFYCNHAKKGLNLKEAHILSKTFSKPNQVVGPKPDQTTAVSQFRGHILWRLHFQTDCVTMAQHGLSHFEGYFKCCRQMNPSTS